MVVLTLVICHAEHALTAHRADTGHGCKRQPLRGLWLEGVNV